MHLSVVRSPHVVRLSSHTPRTQNTYRIQLMNNEIQWEYNRLWSLFFPILSYCCQLFNIFVHFFREVEFQVECTWKTIPWPMAQGCPLGVFITRPICPLQLVSPEFPRTLCQTPFIMIVTTGKRKLNVFHHFFFHHPTNCTQSWYILYYNIYYCAPETFKMWS